MKSQGKMRDQVPEELTSRFSQGGLTAEPEEMLMEIFGCPPTFECGFSSA